MTCIPCRQARTALAQGARSAIRGDTAGIRQATTDLINATAAKAESLRVRAILRK